MARIFFIVRRALAFVTSAFLVYFFIAPKEAQILETVANVRDDFNGLFGWLGLPLKLFIIVFAYATFWFLRQRSGQIADIVVGLPSEGLEAKVKSWYNASPRFSRFAHVILGPLLFAMVIYFLLVLGYGIYLQF